MYFYLHSENLFCKSSIKLGFKAKFLLLFKLTGGQTPLVPEKPAYARTIKCLKIGTACREEGDDDEPESVSVVARLEVRERLARVDGPGAREAHGRNERAHHNARVRLHHRLEHEAEPDLHLLHAQTRALILYAPYYFA